MPYTPPHQSPSASPASSRSSSISIHDPSISTASLSKSVLFSLSNPPRSATYLHKNRRAPTVVPVPVPNKHQHAAGKTSIPVRTPAQQGFLDPRSGGSIHQSPPPVDNGLSLIPAGAVISPPDSCQNSSDDEESTGDGSRRGRDLDSISEQQLKEAIKNIPQRRQPSPDSAMPRKTPSPIDTEKASRRAPHHQRSTSEFSFLQVMSSPKQDSGSGSDVEDDYRIAPPMVRKKSGELVKSSLKTPNRSRPSSMPSTPTFPKVVHFDSEIEHVRHFLHSEKPSAVSAGSSPVESYDGESEYPFEDSYHAREPAVEWEIFKPNFPEDLEARRNMPVRVERVYLSNDSKNLCGTVAVANISFHKTVVVRFTLDYWQTTSEVCAEFTNDVRRRHREDGFDRFAFTIKLADQANLENKRLLFCVRYTVAGQEHWDNNGGHNFQVDFKKKKPYAGKSGTQRLSGLPRSRPSPTSARPRSMPNFDELGTYNQMFYDTSRAVDSGDDEPVVMLRPKSKISATNEDGLSARRTNPSGNAFGNRYDFGASLNAAIKAANQVVGSKRSGLEKKCEVTEKQLEDSPYFKFGGGTTMPSSEPKKPQETSIKASSVVANRATPGSLSDAPSSTALESPSNTGAGPPEIFRPDVFVAEKPSIESTSYRELLDNYCFYGSSKQTSFSAQSEISEKKSLEAITSQATLISAAVFNMGARTGSPVSEQLPNPSYATSSPAGSPPSLSTSLRSSGNVSPIPMNYAGFRHSRRPSGAFRFEPTHAPTAIC